MCDFEPRVEEIERAIQTFTDMFEAVNKQKCEPTKRKTPKQKKKHSIKNKEFEEIYNDLLNQLYVSKDKQQPLTNQAIPPFKMPKLVQMF